MNAATECHSNDAKELKAGLRLDSRAAVLQGGETGPAVTVGKPAESLLVDAVRWQSLEMPPQEKLSSSQIATLVKWVADGAPWPATDIKSNADEKTTYDWQQLRSGHWSFRPVTIPPLPQVNNDAWPQNEVDYFVLAELEKTGLSPSRPADARTLIRRMYFDLIGLPPTPSVVDGFTTALATDRHAAIEAVIERLLNSPHYGERWGRHWLDVARYSDGYGGFLDNRALPQAWRYRGLGRRRTECRHAL